MSGPLTNIALAMKLDPGLPTRLKEIFIMGGNTGYNKLWVLKNLCCRDFSVTLRVFLHVLNPVIRYLEIFCVFYDM